MTDITDDRPLSHDLELQLLPDWRFCRIPKNSKAPNTIGWHLHPLHLAEISSSHNVGVMMGPVSNGLLAIDFDGESAFQYWDEHIRCPIPRTITWASGRDGRCQMAFRIEPELWPHMPNKFAERTGDGEQLEWRWANTGVGIQSVLPPSIHPELRTPYFWVVRPSECGLAAAPNELLEWAISRNTRRIAAENDYAGPPPAELTEDAYERVDAHLKKLKQYRPVLDYDDWLRVVAATSRELGAEIAALTLQQYWPEVRQNEYRRKMRTLNPNRSPSMGTIIHMIRQHEADYLLPKTPLQTAINKLRATEASARAKYLKGK